ncbi:MAG: hypothetical protein CL484_00405 [Acidobacteria bacterium]|nr:hypothetical protein [Acidobacteriota bacterium]
MRGNLRAAEAYLTFIHQVVCGFPWDGFKPDWGNLLDQAGKMPAPCWRRLRGQVGTGQRYCDRMYVPGQLGQLNSADAGRATAPTLVFPGLAVGGDVAGPQFEIIRIRGGT